MKALRYYVLLGIGIFGISWGSILTRLSGAPGYVCATWRIVFSTMFIFLLFGWKHIDEIREIFREKFTIAFIAGITLALHLLLWMESLSYTSVAISTTIVDTHPIFATIITYVFLKEKPTKIQILGLIIAFIGVLILFSPWKVSITGLYGPFLAFIAAITEAIYFSSGRFMRRKYSIEAYATSIYLIAAVFSIIYTITIAKKSLFGYPIRAWTAFVLLALLPMLLGHTTMNYLLKYLSTITVTASFLAEPVIASIIAIFLLSEVPEAYTIVGMAITILGVLMSIIGEEYKK